MHGDSPYDDLEIAEEMGIGYVRCKFCGNRARAEEAHLHDEGWVGDECCWDERLRSTE
jgi:hypothetical protein